MKRKIISAILSLILMITAAIPAYAESAKQKSTRIYTIEELAAISGNGSYVIYDDIDATGFDWKGIKNFGGTLLAMDDAAIINLKSDECGLFRKLSSNAVIKNIRLENAEIVTDTKMLGGIASYIPASSENVLISNCSVSGLVNTVYSKDSKLNYCGAIAGVVSSKSCTIVNCSSSANVEAMLGEGGIVGLNRGEISGSVFTGRVGCTENDVVYYYPDEDEYPLIYVLSMTSGGITAVNFGKITGCSVLMRDFDSATYFGIISGINVKNKGRIERSFSPDTFDPSIYDHEYYNAVANELTSKQYSSLFV